MKKMIAVLVMMPGLNRRANISHIETVQKKLQKLKESCGF
jgi:hypothetical protein